MKAILSCLSAMLIVSVPWSASAQSKTEKDEPPTTRLVLHTAGEARPALKYQLLPGLLERKAGNAAVLYNKIAIYKSHESGKHSDEVQDDIARWLEMPLRDLPQQEVAGTLERFSHVLRDLKLAGRRADCDWQLPLGEEDVFSLLLPELQEMRKFARLVALRARLQIAQRRPEEAIETLRTGFALSRHVAEGPTLINALVGIAICRLMCDRIEELVQQPGAPNLYWALTSLPRPWIDMRAAMETEAAFLYLAFPDLRQLYDTGRSPVYWQDFTEKWSESYTRWAGGSEVPRWQRRLAMIAVGLKGYPMARRYLIERGRSAAEVEAMPVPQVVAIYMLETYEEFRDEMFKWFSVPYWQARQGAEKAEDALREEARQREIVPLATLLLPALGAARFRVAQNERDIAALRTIEALRIYGAAHGGKLPERLDEVSEVPLPLDPVHGKPFRYRCEGDAAILESPAPPGKSPSRHGLRYEIRFAETSSD